MLYMVLTESAGSDAAVRLFRTLAAADEHMDSEIREFVSDGERNSQVKLAVVDDTNPDIAILYTGEGCREWYGIWPEHWNRAVVEMRESAIPDEEDRPRLHRECGFVHGPDDCEK